MKIEIASAQITPNPVNVGGSIILAVVVNEITEYLENLKFSQMETKTFAELEHYVY